MEELGLALEDAASSLGLSLRQTQDLIEGGLEIDVQLAHRLAETFGSSATFWLRREQLFRGLI